MSTESIESFLRSRVPLYSAQSGQKDDVMITYEDVEGHSKPLVLSGSLEGSNKKCIKYDHDLCLDVENFEWGTGVSWLIGIINRSEKIFTKYNISDESLNVMKKLLKRKFKDLIFEDKTPNSTSIPIITKCSPSCPIKQYEVSKEINSNSTRPDAPISLTKSSDNPDTSTFMSILRIINNTMKRSIKRSDFSGNVYIKSAFVPMNMDASDIINASLEFLSSQIPPSDLIQCSLDKIDINKFHQSQYFPDMPLITRNGEIYHISPHYSLSLNFSLENSNFKQRLFNLERFFYSTTSYYVGRFRFCPRCESDEKERRAMTLGDDENNKEEFLNKFFLKKITDNIGYPMNKKKRKPSSGI